MARVLTPNQTRDPARGSFLVRPQMIREGRLRTFIAPTEPTASGGFETFSNAVEFKPTKE